jgi:periplasmic copper chaperone A
MRRRAVAAVAVTAAVVAGGLSSCGDDDAPPPSSSASGIEVSAAWARPTPAGTTVGAVYLTLRSGDEDALMAVQVDPAIAGGAAVHETMTEGSDGMMTMTPVSALALAPGDDVVLDPGGDHVMLTDLAAPLTDGETFPIELEFRDHAPVTVTVVVGNP